MSGGGRLSGIDMANDNDVDVALFLAPVCVVVEVSDAAQIDGRGTAQRRGNGMDGTGQDSM